MLYWALHHKNVYSNPQYNPTSLCIKNQQANFRSKAYRSKVSSKEGFSQDTSRCTPVNIKMWQEAEKGYIPVKAFDLRCESVTYIPISTYFQRRLHLLCQLSYVEEFP